MHEWTVNDEQVSKLPEDNQADLVTQLEDWILKVITPTKSQQIKVPEKTDNEEKENPPKEEKSEKAGKESKKQKKKKPSSDSSD